MKKDWITIKKIAHVCGYALLVFIRTIIKKLLAKVHFVPAKYEKRVFQASLQAQVSLHFYLWKCRIFSFS